MTARDVLSRMRELLASPSAWCQGAYAQTEQGDDVPAEDVAAVRWDLLGAFDRVTGGRDHHDAFCLLLDACGTELSTYNDADERTHTEILAVVETALELA